MVDRILTAEAWANARIKEPVRLADWAKAIKLNPVYFGRIFKQETGLRPAWNGLTSAGCKGPANTSRALGKALLRLPKTAASRTNFIFRESSGDTSASRRCSTGKRDSEFYDSPCATAKKLLCPEFSF